MAEKTATKTVAYPDIDTVSGMFTIVKYPPVSDHRRSVGEPRPEIISHRDGEQETNKWSEKMRKEETTYKHLRHHRDELLESEMIYKKKIKELEKEKAELFNIYEPTYQENKVLKSVLEHGPDAVKMKKLQKARKGLQEDVETLKYENKILTDQMNEIVQKQRKARDHILDKNWQQVLSNNKKNKAKGEMKITQGPFPAKEDIPSKKALPMPEKEDTQEQDMYDLELDSVQKEIQVILNKLKCLKKQKRNVDYAIAMGKGAVVKNSPLQNAIIDKLDEDLNVFKDHLKSGKKKHDDLRKKLTERENDAKTKEKAEKDTDQNKKLDEQVIEVDKNKSYKTSETQTEVPAELKRAKTNIVSERFKLNKKHFSTRKRNRAVQTDVLEGLNLLKPNIERTKHLDQNGKKKLQVQNTKRTKSKKVSSKKMALEYAKKLVVRRETNPNRIEMSEHASQKSRNDVSQDISATNQTKLSIPPKRNNPLHTNNRDMPVGRSRALPVAEDRLETNEDTSQENNIVTEYPKQIIHGKYAKQTKCKTVSSKKMALEYAKTLVVRRKETSPNRDEMSRHVPQKSRKDTSQENTATEYPQQSIHAKRSKPVYANHSDMLLDRSQFPTKSKTSKSNTDSGSSRIKSRNVRDPYRDRIMTPEIDYVRQKKNNHESKSLYTSRRSQRKSKSMIDVNDVEAQAKIKSEKHEAKISLSSEKNLTESPFLEENRVWKSESNLNAFVEDDVNENQPVEEIKEEEKRDVSAYDKVLFDLKNQYKVQGDSVYQEFQRTVQNIRHVKKSVRENQKINKNRELDFFPGIVPYAPLRFTNDVRHVTQRELRQLMEQN